MYLCYDQVESLKSYRFRVRVWLGRGHTPVILVSRAGGAKLPPLRSSARIVTHFYRSLLAPVYSSSRDELNPDIPFYYYEAFGREPGSTGLQNVGFRRVCDARGLRFDRAKRYNNHPWWQLERRAGEDVEQA